MTVTVFMVAEKPMLADSIAKLLSDNKCSKRKGWNGACSISEYNGNFLGQSAKFKVGLVVHFNCFRLQVHVDM